MRVDWARDMFNGSGQLLSIMLVCSACPCGFDDFYKLWQLLIHKYMHKHSVRAIYPRYGLSPFQSSAIWRQSYSLLVAHSRPQNSVPIVKSKRPQHTEEMTTVDNSSPNLFDTLNDTLISVHTAFVVIVQLQAKKGHTTDIPRTYGGASHGHRTDVV